MLKKGCRIAVSLLLALSIAGSAGTALAQPVSSPPETASPESAAPESASSETAREASGDGVEYDEYRLANADKPFGEPPIVLPAEEAAGTNGKLEPLTRPDEKDADATYTAALLEEEGAYVTWEFDVPAAGLYQMQLLYTPLGERQDLLDFSVRINGQLPFEEAGSVVLNRTYEDSTAIQQDKYGNDLRPRPAEVRLWQTSMAQEYDGRYNEPYAFFLEAGPNTVEVRSNQGNLAVGEIRFLPAEEKMTYAEYLEKHKDAKKIDAGFSKTFQAEQMYRKSASSLYAVQDRSDAAIEPSSPSSIRLNTLGNGNWKYDGQWVSWKLDAPEAGMYTIALKAKQNYLRGLPVVRRMYINGEIPFQEAENLTFAYQSSWYVQFLGDGEQAFQIYLQEGENELKLEVVSGYLAETLRTIGDCVYELNRLYRQIIMVTGVNPDPMRDYYLSDEIPDLVSGLSAVTNSLKTELQRVEELNGTDGTALSVLEETIYLFEQFLEEPEMITDNLTAFRDSISSLGSCQLSIREQPMDLDYVLLTGVAAELPRAKAGFWEGLVYEVQAFINSFFTDYNTIGSHAEDSITVWIASGRDQSQILRSLIDDTFTPKTGIQVNLTIDSGVLTQATLAGEGPDVSLMVARGTPVNLAMRNALYDLSSFPDFDEAAQGLHESALIPFEYQGKYYALPETQVFNMLFYRKDVFEELGLTPPDTWDEMYHVISVLQRNNMSVGIGEGMGTFEMFLYQRGVPFYADDRIETNLDSDEALEAFTEWTSLFKQLGLPRTFDFYNRFRTGEMPLGIQAYTFSNTLEIAAPELRGQWDMLPLPAYIDENGNASRAQPSDGTACVILAQTEDPDASWEFVKWWTSAETQAQYGNDLEALIGSSARYTPANQEAFLNINWPKATQERILEQWESVTDAPQVPGNYIVSRQLTNAFRNVCDYNKNPKEMLNKYNRLINEEIQRKRREFLLDE